MFPINPTIGQQYIRGNVIWTWRNNIWEHSKRAELVYQDAEPTIVKEENDLWIDYDSDASGAKSFNLIKQYRNSNWVDVANTAYFAGTFSQNTATQIRIVTRLFKFNTVVIDAMVEPHNAEDWWIRLVNGNTNSYITNFVKTEGRWIRGGSGGVQSRTMANEWLMILEQGRSHQHAPMHLRLTITGNEGPHKQPVLHSEINGADRDGDSMAVQTTRYALCQPGDKISNVDLYFDGNAHIIGSIMGYMT